MRCLRFGTHLLWQGFFGLCVYCLGTSPAAMRKEPWEPLDAAEGAATAGGGGAAEAATTCTTIGGSVSGAAACGEGAPESRNKAAAAPTGSHAFRMPTFPGVEGVEGSTPR